jgi:hypothetical protein
VYFDFFYQTREYGLRPPHRRDLATIKSFVGQVCSDDAFAPVYRFQLWEAP